MIKINIANDFSKTPGFGLREDGPYSGEEFRSEFLDPIFRDKDSTEDVQINLDGGSGYSYSFLEEAFGGLVRKFGSRCIKRLSFISQEDPLLVGKVIEDMYYLARIAD